MEVGKKDFNVLVGANIALVLNGSRAIYDGNPNLELSLNGKLLRKEFLEMSPDYNLQKYSPPLTPKAGYSKYKV